MAATDTLPMFTNRKYIHCRNIFMKAAMFFLVCAFTCFTVSISTTFWNYDARTGFYQGIWTMYRCESFDLQTCIEIQPLEDERVTLLQVFMGLSYSFLVVGCIHASIQFALSTWYTTAQAVVSVIILSLSALCFIVGFALYFQRSLVSNFALHILLGFSAELAIAAALFIMLALAIFGVEIARRSVDRDDAQVSLREMRQLTVAGPPPKRVPHPKATTPMPGFMKVTTQITGTVIAAAKLWKGTSTRQGALGGATRSGADRVADRAAGAAAIREAIRPTTRPSSTKPSSTPSSTKRVDSRLARSVSGDKSPLIKSSDGAVKKQKVSKSKESVKDRSELSTGSGGRTKKKTEKISKSGTRVGDDSGKAGKTSSSKLIGTGKVKSGEDKRASKHSVAHKSSSRLGDDSKVKSRGSKTSMKSATSKDATLGVAKSKTRGTAEDRPKVSKSKSKQGSLRSRGSGLSTQSKSNSKEKKPKKSEKKAPDNKPDA